MAGFTKRRRSVQENEPDSKKSKFNPQDVIEHNYQGPDLFGLLPNEMILKILNFANFVTWETCKSLNKRFYEILAKKNPFLGNVFWYIVFRRHSDSRNGFEENILLTNYSTKIYDSLENITDQFQAEYSERVEDCGRGYSSMEAKLHLIDLTDLKEMLKFELKEALRAGIMAEDGPEYSDLRLNKRSLLNKLCFFKSKIEESIDLNQEDLEEEEDECESTEARNKQRKKREEQKKASIATKIQERLDEACDKLKISCSSILDVSENNINSLYKKSIVKDHLIPVVNSLRILFAKENVNTPAGEDKVVYLLRLERKDGRLFQPKPYLIIGKNGLRQCFIANYHLLRISSGTPNVHDIARMDDAELIKFIDVLYNTQRTYPYIFHLEAFEPNSLIETRSSVYQYGP